MQQSIMANPEYTTNAFDTQSTSINTPWSSEKAKAWQERTGWLVGCNYITSNAVNQLEMWQPETFDLPTIDKELGWAANLGFNTVRVFLHSILWYEDSEAYLKRIDQFLTVADKHGIRTMFVFFDAVWDPNPLKGIQKEPTKGIHNSGWVQCPGFNILNDVNEHDTMKDYVQGIISYFRIDERVVIWDLFNEPDNVNAASYNDQHYVLPKADLSLLLLRKAFEWARAVNPIQPLTSGPWQRAWNVDEELSLIDHFMFTQSDVISFHCYEKKAEMEERILALKRYNKPMFCTEYMARPLGSTFEDIMPLLKEHGVGAYNWGFIEGRSQTHFPWDSWVKAYEEEPELWFHDIYRTNGEAYNKEEVEFIKRMTGKIAEKKMQVA
jgi:hypothetical protein